MRRCVGESSQFSCSFPCERLRACSGVVSIVKLNDHSNSPFVESVYLAAVVTGSSNNYGLSCRPAVDSRRFLHRTRPLGSSRRVLSLQLCYVAILFRNQSVVVQSPLELLIKLRWKPLGDRYLSSAI